MAFLFPTGEYNFCYTDPVVIGRGAFKFTKCLMSKVVVIVQYVFITILELLNGTLPFRNAIMSYIIIQTYWLT